MTTGPTTRPARTARPLAILGALGALGPAACGGSTGPGDAGAARLALSDSTVSVRVGDDAAVTAAARDAAGQPLVGRRIFWSSRDTTVATVSQAGVIHGVAPGTTQVSANTEGQSAVAAVTVMARPAASLAVDPTTAQLVVGARQRLGARVLNDAGAPVATPVTWTSLDPGIVSVTADGEIQALATGVGAVRLVADELTATAVVVVTPVPVASVQVAPGAASLVVGATQQLTVTASDASGTPLAGRIAAWTSRDPGIAAVASDGRVTGIAPGTATIGVTIEGQSATASVTVRPAPVAAVVVAPSTSSIGVGGTVRLTAATNDAAGNGLAGRAVAWTSSATGVARVAADGTVTGVAPGTASISAQSEGVTGTATVTVVAVAAPAVAAVAVSPASVTLTTGDTRTFTAAPRTADGTTLSGRTVTWTSSAASIATVTGAGLVTAVSPGTAQILATVDGITGTSAVTVQRPPVAKVTVSPGAASVAPRGTTTLAATTSDANNATLTGRVVTWASSSDAIATVTSGGVVTGVAPGTAMIRATSEGVTGTATVTVAVVIRVTVSPTTFSIRDRGALSMRTVQLSATNQDGVSVAAPDVTWSSSNPAAAIVTASGLVTAVSSGSGTATTVITATYRGATATSTITVTR